MLFVLVSSNCSNLLGRCEYFDSFLSSITISVRGEHVDELTPAASVGQREVVWAR